MSNAESRVLVDLLQSLVSQTEWSYAEIWIPDNSRLVISAIWARNDATFGTVFQELESVSRSMSFLPDICIPGKVWKSRQRIWVQNISSVAHFSPRYQMFARAGIHSAAAWAIEADSGKDFFGVIVLMSRRNQIESEEHFEALEGMSICCLPYLQQAIGLPLTLEPNADLEENSDLSLSIDQQESTKPRRTHIKYRAPFRDATTVPRKPKFQDRPVACMIQLKASLQKFPRDAQGSLNVSRTAVCWNMLEQLCELAVPWNDVLSQIADELRLSLFSDDLMSTDDGLSLVRVPYFAQIPVVIEQNKRLHENLSQCLSELRRIESELNSCRESERKALERIQVLQHKLLIANRKVIKNRLTIFLEKRTLSATARKGVEDEIQGLKLRIQQLEKSLMIEVETKKHDLALNGLEVESIRSGFQDLTIQYPAMVACLQTAPAPVSSAGETIQNPSFPLHSCDTQLHAMRKQLLILRNACISDFEKKHALTDGNEELQNSHRVEFMGRMEELRLEIKALDERIAKGFDPPQYDLMDAKEVLNARRETQKVARRASIFENMARAPGDVSTDADEQEHHQESDVENEASTRDENKELVWTEKELQNHMQVNVWRGYTVRCKTTREIWRKLDNIDVLNLVYQVFEYKANADVASSSTLGGEYTTTERAFYRFLERKYGSKDIANLVAFDILKAIDEQRDHVKMFQLFAMSMTGGWYDADWKYILRSQQFASAVHPGGFPNLLAVEAFLRRYMYRDAETHEIQKFIKGFAVFPAYNRQLAQCRENDIDESVSPEMFAEYISHLLYMREDPKIRKVEIMYSVAKMEQHEYVTYEHFENFVGLCLPVERNVSICQMYYRMLTKAHPTNNFPARSLIHSAAACELESLMAYHSCHRELRVSLVDPKSAMML